MAVERVRERLLRATGALRRAGVPYAVIGGNAVAVWVASVDVEAVRNTKDVDILLRREDLPRAIEAMRQADFELTDVAGVSMFLDRIAPNPRSAVHIVFAGERVFPHNAHPAPQPTQTSPSPDGFITINLLELLIMKLQAFRDIDRVHVRDLMAVGLVDDALIEGLPHDLRGRFEQLRAAPDG